jgi:hypothetical protein
MSNSVDLFEFLFLIIILIDFQFIAMMAHTLENFLNILHIAIVEHRLTEFNVSKVTLTLSGFSTSFALLIHCANSKS